MRHAVSGIAITVLVLVALASAQDHSAHGTKPLAIVGSDYAYDGPDSIEAGFVSLTFENAGAEPHHIQVVRLNDGVTPEEAVAALQQGPEVGMQLVELVGGVGVIMPGQSQTAIVDFSRPGTYLELCLVPDADGVPHFALGMARFFQVTPAATPVARPTIEPDLTVRLVDFGYVFPSEIKPGPQVWEVVNDGPQPHEMLLMRVVDGVTVEQALASLAEETPTGPPLAIPVGGVQGLQAGLSNYLDLDLAPGNYIVVCHIPDPATGQPHLALGMISVFTVAN